MEEDNRTHFSANLNLDDLDEKLMRFVILRNEMVSLAKEIGFEVSSGILELKAM